MVYLEIDKWRVTTDLLIGTQPNRPGRPERADQTNSEPTYHGVNIRSSKLKIRILGSSSKSKMRRAVIHETLGCCFNKLSMLVAWMYSRYMSYCSRYFFSSRGLVFLNGSSCLETTDSCSRRSPRYFAHCSCRWCRSSCRTFNSPFNCSTSLLNLAEESMGVGEAWFSLQ